jgi:hypothetical protein
LVNAGAKSNLDYNNWIQNAAQLSCFFFNQGRFAEAHHILNAADKMLELGKVWYLLEPQQTMFPKLCPLYELTWYGYASLQSLCVCLETQACPGDLLQRTC